MKPRHWFRFSLVLALGTAACASPGRTSSNRLGKPAADASAMVRVANHNFSDVTVYVVQSGMRSRLGLVTGLTTRRFSLPQGVSLVGGDIRIFADPVGDAQTYLSPPVRLAPGQALDLTLGAILNLSSVSVWN